MKTINRVLSAYVQLRVQNNQAAHIITTYRRQWQILLLNLEFIVSFHHMIAQ